MSCGKTGCPNEGRWYPTFIVPPPKKLRGESARGLVNLPLCDEHTRGVPLSDFLTDEGWAQIEAGFTSAGYAKPKREIVTLGWTHMDDPFAQEASKRWK